MDRPGRHRALALVVTLAAAIGIAHVPIARPPGESWEANQPARRPFDGGAMDDAAIDPNIASLDALERLPGVGPSLARRIADARDAGVFCRPEDLDRVRGIGPHTIARLRVQLTFSDPRCRHDAQ